MNLPKQNPSLDIAEGRSRREVHWKNRVMTWHQFLLRLEETHRTVETFNDYMKAPKSRQDEIKDIGGFVGGLLVSGRRNPGSVVHRQLLTLDLDSAPQGFWESFSMVFDFTACVYSTHKHCPEKPRLRLIAPLSRTCNPTEYEAIGRWVAGVMGIDYFDDTGFQHYRLMYWPSTSKDAEYLFRMQDGDILDADYVLSRYQDYTDSTQWPVSSAKGARVLREITKQGDPLLKRGLIGAFCRTYTIPEVIEKYLGDVYEPAGDDRFTYVRGSTAGGLIIYDDKYAYSHHGTDPISGKLCNAFDLVRLHLFGIKDENSKAVAVTKLPSYKAMIDFAAQDSAVRLQAGEERLEAARLEFGDPDAAEMVSRETEEGKAGGLQVDDTGETLIMLPEKDLSGLGLPVVETVEESQEQRNEWLKTLDPDTKGGYEGTTGNILTILRNDPWLKGKLANNRLKMQPVVLGDLPWLKLGGDYKRGRLFSDDDSSGLRSYIETVYKISTPFKTKDALRLVCLENEFHPVRNYLRGLEWDGVERLDNLLIDYFGCEDSEYMKAITRKWFTAAVARAFKPGVKFDYCLTLLGEEGIYKSTFFRLLSEPWFTDNFSFHMVGTKQAIEQITGFWMIEIGELTGLKYAELEAIKQFLSRCTDSQRWAFKEYLYDLLRQCVFAGSTNQEGFLKGVNGNRRFWVADTKVGQVTKPIHQLAEERDQVWAEAAYRFRKGEPLQLSGKLEAQARAKQEEHTEQDSRFNLVQEYLEKKLPENWEEMTWYQRRNFLQGDELSVPGTVERTRVTIHEIWIECFNATVRDLNNANTKPIHDIMKKMPGWEAKKIKYKGNVVRGFLKTVRGCHNDV